MKKIKLTQGKISLIDDKDFLLVSKYKWCASYSKLTKTYYALSNRKTKAGKFKTIKMHRIIMAAKSGFFVDHINHDTLDNRRNNLRIVNKHQNAMNRKGHDDSLSKYKGVTFNKNKYIQKWQASIMKNYKKIHLGYFTNQRDAAMAYDLAARKHFKHYAFLNFPDRNI